MGLTSKGDKKSRKEAVGELRDLTVEDLRVKLAEEREALMRARFSHAAASLEKTSQLKSMRRQIARMETILNEKEQRS